MRFKSSKNNTLKGFTLLEILVVIAIVGFVFSITLPGISATQVRTTTLLGNVSEIASLTYQYQHNSYTGLNNKTYGIRFTTNSYSIFIGPNFASAESQETIALTSGITISAINLQSGNEIVFPKGSLKPSNSGNIQITNQTETYQLSINSEGYIEYYKI